MSEIRFRNKCQRKTISDRTFDYGDGQQPGLRGWLCRVQVWIYRNWLRLGRHAFVVKLHLGGPESLV